MPQKIYVLIQNNGSNAICFKNLKDAEIYRQKHNDKNKGWAKERYRLKVPRETIVFDNIKDFENYEDNKLYLYIYRAKHWLKDRKFDSSITVEEIEKTITLTAEQYIMQDNSSRQYDGIKINRYSKRKFDPDDIQEKLDVEMKKCFAIIKHYSYFSRKRKNEYAKLRNKIRKIWPIEEISI